MSSVPVVLAALAELARATLPQSQVINGGESSVETTTGRLLLIGDDEIVIERQFDSMSTASTSEEYVVPLRAAVDLATRKQTDADAQAFADYEALVQAILDHPSGPSLGLEASGVLSVLPVGSHRFGRTADPDGRQSTVRFTVRVYAQLS